MSLTADTITVKQIKALRNEALAADDLRQVDWCDIALAAHERSDSEGHALISPTGVPTTRSKAREVCADVINYARGRDDAEADEDVSTDADGATVAQIKTIRSRAYNATARAMASHGVKLTWGQVDLLGDEAMDWLKRRLNLKTKTTDRGVIATPR